MHFQIGFYNKVNILLRFLLLPSLDYDTYFCDLFIFMDVQSQNNFFYRNININIINSHDTVSYS